MTYVESYYTVDISHFVLLLPRQLYQFFMAIAAAKFVLQRALPIERHERDEQSKCDSQKAILAVAALSHVKHSREQIRPIECKAAGVHVHRHVVKCYAGEANNVKMRINQRVLEIS